jgi:hypothetical protein
MSVPAAYVGVILIWSTTPLAIQWSAQGASFSFAVMARMLIGLAICLILLVATRTAFPFTAAARQLYAISGLSLFMAMLLTYWGALHIPSGLIFGHLRAVAAAHRRVRRAVAERAHPHAGSHCRPWAWPWPGCG